MSESKLPKQVSDRIGRDFNLLFSRVSMYHMDHPTTRDSLERFYNTIGEAFQTLSPISLILNRDQFFIEDELLDVRINTSKMINHFKKADIQSVSFEEGLSASELHNFIEIFTDLTSSPTPDLLKSALTNRRIANIRINYVVYRKMTADDEVHRRDQSGPGTHQTSEGPSGSIEAILQKMVAQGVLLDEVEKSLSLASLVRDPEKFSNTLIASDLAAYQQDHGRTSQPGTALARELGRLRHGIEEPDEATDSIDLAQLAQAVFSLRKELLKGIQAQKAMGVLFPNEDKIRQQADDLSDQVLIQLMKEEYNKGETSIKRLAQILCRLIPQPRELIRLLPKLKDALLEEGMSLSDFLQLLREIGQELQSEELAGLFHDSAEQIGVSGDDLIEEIRHDPSGAAELIILAAEIRKGTGDSNVLCDLLVDYIERIGFDLALHKAEKRGQEGGRHLREVVSTIHRDLVSQIAQKAIDPSILKAIDLSLQQRLEQTVRQLKATWIVRQIPSHTSKQATRNSIMKVLENASDDEEELHGVLRSVLLSLQERGLDNNVLQEIYDEIVERRAQHKKQTDQEGVPKGTFARGTLLFFIKKELSRSSRYKTPFSVITFSIVKATPQESVLPGTVNRNEIRNHVIERLVNISRETDIVGVLDDNKICALLTMTGEEGAKMALRRIMGIFHSQPFVVKEIPLDVRLVSVTTAYHPDLTPTLEAFVKAIETELAELLKPVETWFLLEKENK